MIWALDVGRAGTVEKLNVKIEAHQQQLFACSADCYSLDTFEEQT